ncbi:hypothetical protein HZC09_00665 [Candidatus Micrarchaeota archaeon]|nr:hypothetical protein [Candidatus Micrarchaeota archaeon]
MGFVWFVAGFEDLSYEKKAETTEEAAALLRDAKAITERKVFCYAPLDLKGIEALVPKNVEDIPSLAQHLSRIKQGDLSKKFAPLVKFQMPEDEAKRSKVKGDPVDLAWAYYMHLLARKINPAHAPQTSKTDKKEARLAANYGDWTIVKKVNLGWPDREILCGLLGIQHTLIQKTPEFSQNFSDYDEKLDRLLESFPERKSFARLPEILNAVAHAEELNTEDFELKDYALTKALARAGFPPYISNDVFSSLYPDLKIPKPRGNFGSKKKK